MPNFTANDSFPTLPLISSDSGQAYRCPGESATISQAVHFARLKAGWTACSECIWNSHQATTHGRNNQAFQTRQQAGHEIRRTCFGVRGAYLNAIDRFRGAQLAAIFATHLANLSRLDAAGQSSEFEQQSGKSPSVKIAIGYDGRMGSTDIFAGVVSAVLQNGCDVVDVGRCTAASLLSASRSDRGVAGCLLVTGSGGASGEVGIDVFRDNGRSVAIPWPEFGVGIRVQPKEVTHDAASQPTTSQKTMGTYSAASTISRSTDVWEHLHQIRHPATHAQTELHPTQCRSLDVAQTNAGATDIEVTDIGATVILPKMSNSRRLFRAGRSSGELSTFASEAAYLNWLRRWWPRTSVAAVLFRVADELVSQRLIALADERSIPLLLRRIGDDTVEKDTSGRFPLTFEISEDDRFMTVVSRRGRTLKPDELAAWINKATRTSSSHVTAHASRDGDRLLLVDVASPSSGRSHEVISDGLAVSGFLLTLISNDRNQFPT